jgi:hypothetical protein
MLPEKSQKVVDYWWPVVEAYTKIQMEKNLPRAKLLEVMTSYLETKTFLVRERKATMLKVMELINAVDSGGKITS